MKKHFFHTRAFFVLLAMVCGLQAYGQAGAEVFEKYHKAYFTEAPQLLYKYWEERSDIEKKFRTAVRALGAVYNEEGNDEGWRATRNVLRKFGEVDIWDIEGEFLKRKNPFDMPTDPEKENIELNHMIEQRAKMLKTVDEAEVKARDELRAKHIAYLEEVRDNSQLKNEEARILRNDIELFKNPPTEEEVIEKMKRIIIPEVNFREAKIQDIIEFFYDASREYDDPILPLDRRGIRFVLRLPDAADIFANESDENRWPTINFTTRYSNLHTIFITTLELARLDYRIREGFVFIMPIAY